MSELAEFLLARISEDEAPTWTLAPYECPPGCCAPAGWVGAQCRYCDPAPVYGGTVEAMTRSAEDHAEAIHQRSRVLAKCGADRRIVDSATYWIKRTQSRRPDMTPTQRMTIESRARAAEEALRFLALPYADHPDYDERWRP